MKEFRAFPSTVVEVDGEIVPSYEPGNGNEPKYNKTRIEDIGEVCLCNTIDNRDEKEEQ